ncbi:GntR family transcriptional regulator [Cellulomonas shaoxiangyii]|uniref:GntR family transcriptional regulator n=1 Tax=Cellulomonas shaoxiangyii TaxID=2566013 RepID=A0A4P7SIT5_9CELL|nr:GntR family transcriptional regulator [Cellulomonas shaoxiangyii]QCB94149.1 GntR family transcriptional regulator [Cellulomonas shaoxiangyii]TGY86642.1 GntR family transcriptional regulator [Cellulomonas shaoxiangyii]
MDEKFRGVIDVPTVADEVYRRLRAAITSGHLAPGALISLRQVAQAYGVSTMPVRDAVNTLRADGLVVVERRSVTVTRLHAEEIHEIFQIRLRLEQLASQWALDNVTDEDVADLTEILDRMAGGAVDVARWRQLNQEFHRRFYDCSRSAHLLELLQNIWDKVEPYMAIYASTVDDFREADRQHRLMLRHIRARDLSALLVELSEHLEHTEATVVAALRAG